MINKSSFMWISLIKGLKCKRSRSDMYTAMMYWMCTPTVLNYVTLCLVGKIIKTVSCLRQARKECVSSSLLL